MNDILTLIPVKYRKYLYAAVAVAAFLFGIWQVSNGDWKQFVAALFAALVAETARQNTDTGA